MKTILLFLLLEIYLLRNIERDNKFEIQEDGSDKKLERQILLLKSIPDWVTSADKIRQSFLPEEKEQIRKVSEDAPVESYLFGEK